MSEQIIHNSRVHDLIAPLYEARHTEIFNQTEQQRIHDLLADTLKKIRTGCEVPRVLDFGAGTGNLTHHLLNLGATVVASDVSAGCLKELKRSFKTSERLELSMLNGHDLSQFADASFDMVATYSVLHHVPDYLSIVSEFARVVKSGGIVYIDHEVCPVYWKDGTEYQEYCRELTELQFALPNTFLDRLSYLFRQKSWWRYLVTTIMVRWNKVNDEGDIHVHASDHIDWEKIAGILKPRCSLLKETDYLVCREKSHPAPVWGKWHEHCVDMRLLVAEKY